MRKGPVGDVSYNIFITHKITLKCSGVCFLVGDKSFHQLLQFSFFKLFFLQVTSLAIRNGLTFPGKETMRATIMPVASSTLWTLSICDTDNFMLSTVTWILQKTNTAGWLPVRWDAHTHIHTFLNMHVSY